MIARSLFNRFVLTSVLAAVGAFWICRLLGAGPLDQAWAVLSAIVVLAVDHPRTLNASLDCVIGTVAGGAVAALLVAVMPRLQPAELALGVVVIAVLHALVLQWRPGLRMFGSTAVLLFLANADAGSTMRLAEERFVYIAVGVAVSVAVSLAASKLLLVWGKRCLGFFNRRSAVKHG